MVVWGPTIAIAVRCIDIEVWSIEAVVSGTQVLVWGIDVAGSRGEGSISYHQGTWVIW